MNNVLSGLALWAEGESNRPLEETGDPLLDVCRLIGRAMGIEIAAPAWSGDSKSAPAMTLDALSRNSNFRTREVALTGEWYEEDGGPILGFMKEDGRPVALIPDSPTVYTLHDVSLHSKKRVDRDTALKLKDWGVVFYRPFRLKEIRLSDLVLRSQTAGNGSWSLR